MDSVLIDYLRSGNAWVLVGSGPSIEMGYPSWEQLAASAVEATRLECVSVDLSNLNAAMRHKNYSDVFEEAKRLLGASRLLQVLQERLRPSRSGRIYDLIAKWPVEVYLTTNFDDEMQRHLARLGLAFVTYSNSEDHFGYLAPNLSGAIFKIHGDLRSERGLILTTSQYRDIEQSDSWRYWRTKMASVFQMGCIVVVGHSLSDDNIRHVLAAAKEGAGVMRPVCWIAPDVSDQQRREYLDYYRIRVIPYDNRSGDHKNLAHLVRGISDFVPPRTAVRVQMQIEAVSSTSLGSNAGAPGFFVFNKLSGLSGIEEKRAEIIIAALQSAVPRLETLGTFSLDGALKEAGWPKDIGVDNNLKQDLEKRALEQGLLAEEAGFFRVGVNADKLVVRNRQSFEHVHKRFKESLILRLRRDYSSLLDEDVTMIADDIDASLVGYFREGGLSLASTLFASGHSINVMVPSSIVRFISEASARYDDLLKRQAFWSTSVDAFVHAESAEREYLGRISQGFFAFHALGVFGDIAFERMQHAKDTVWIVDSDAQIVALALAGPTSIAFRECFKKLHSMGIRLFATRRLLHETFVHLWFADKVIEENGPSSPYVIAGARGEAPYRKANQFLVGFVKWQQAGNPCDWRGYLRMLLAGSDFTEDGVNNALVGLGIEVVEVRDWPGYSPPDSAEVEERKTKIIGCRQEVYDADPNELEELERKAEPEAEVALIVEKERAGVYHMLSRPPRRSPAWFVSHTSILNLIEPANTRITWQPEAFLRFASTLYPIPDAKATDRAFEAILFSMAESGLSLVDDEAISRVFGGVIDEAKLTMPGQLRVYEETLANKYGESPEAVLNRVPAPRRPMAAIQLANEIALAEERRREIAEKQESAATKRASIAEQKLQQVGRYIRKMEAKKQRSKRKAKGRKTGRKKR